MVSAAACDAGKRHEERVFGPGITITGLNVGPDKPMPADGVIQISFDRYLLPSTILRQSFIVTEASSEIVTGERAPIVTYDPVARTVTLASPTGGEWLKEGQPYKLFLPIPPDDDADDQGVRAIDRAPLHEGQPREIAFFVGPPNGASTAEPKVSFCTDVLPMFAYKCSEASCHGGIGKPAAGLVLDSARGIALTALGRVAQGANTGASALPRDDRGKAFGVNMRLIEPGNPGQSWLLYKIDLARPPAIDAGLPDPFACVPPAGAPPHPPPAPDYWPLAPAQIVADEIERAILDDHVLGREMPYPLEPPPPGRELTPLQQPLTFQEREKIRLWISQGAVINECGGCGAL